MESLEKRIEALEARLGFQAGMRALEDRVAILEGRVGELERRPSPTDPWTWPGPWGPTWIGTPPAIRGSGTGARWSVNGTSSGW
jgi:uncharacterized coiled-coil protein SlyX